MNSNSSPLFKEISVWKRQDNNTIIRYRCFEIVGQIKYFVKSSDFYHYPLKREEVLQLEEYFIDFLFQDALENIPDELFETLEEAITAHENAFN